jgi:hypothetical protein
MCLFCISGYAWCLSIFEEGGLMDRSEADPHIPPALHTAAISGQYDIEFFDMETPHIVTSTLIMQAKGDVW